MKNIFLSLMLTASLFAVSCKSKQNSTTNTTSGDTAVVAPATAPAQISSDDSLQTGVKDAVKDYPGVTTTVNNGEITVSGNIKRDRLPNLLQSLNSLHPKKINNNLTVQ